MAGAALNRATRRSALAALGAGELDLLVVGGGITGAGAALDAVARGLSVGLVEAADLASGTSSKSSKLIHGGLRYLEMGDVGLVREALRERELLLSGLAPHLVRPVPFLWPLRGRGWERAYLGAGLLLYDTLGGARSVPRHRHLSKRGALRAAPALRGDGLAGAVSFHDAAEDDARMVVAVARTAASLGAYVVTRARVSGFLRDGDRVVGATVVDAETEEVVEVRARAVATAAGVWTDRLRGLAGGASATRIRPSKGIHLVIPRDRIPMETGVLARTERSVLFVIPTEDGWLVGDTDTPWDHGPDRVVATGADVDYVLAKLNALLARPVGREDVVGVFAGLRPLVGSAAPADTTRISRSHAVERPVPGLTTIAGGKYTTYRVMAADLVDAAVPTAPPSPTRDVPLVGAEGFGAVRAGRDALAARWGLGPAAIDRLLRRYGAEVDEVLEPAAANESGAEELPGGQGVLAAEVVFACTHEGALRLEDVLERRTRLAITTPDRGLAAAEATAALMAAELGWEAGRTAAEVEAWRRRVAAERAGEAARDDAAALAAYATALGEEARAAA